MVIVTCRVREQLMHRLCCLRILNGKQVIHGRDTQDCLQGLAKCSPLFAIRDKQDVRLVGADELVANVIFRATGVFGASFIEQPVSRVSWSVWGITRCSLAEGSADSLVCLQLLSTTTF